MLTEVHVPLTSPPMSVSGDKKKHMRHARVKYGTMGIEVDVDY
jgi:hypothetical protein